MNTKIHNIFVEELNFMPIITLTTDFGNKDPFVASVKGKIYTELPNAKIVDISHEIEPFDIAEGAFVVKNSYSNFPKGSIHIIGVDDLMTPHKRPIAAYIDEHYFLASNNGILSLINTEINPKEVIEIDIPQMNTDSVFTTQDVFVPVACHLARGGKLSVVGHHLKEFKELSVLRPVIKDDKVIIGTVIYVDHFGNSIVNISKKLFQNVGKKREFVIRYRNYEFNEIHENYRDIVKDFDQETAYFGNGMALFGSSGYLEIAMYRSNPRSSGSASTLYGLTKGSEIRIEFL